MSPKPIKVWWKEGMNLPAWGKSGSKLVIPKSADALDWYGWSLAVPTVIVGAVGSKLIVGAFFRSRIHWHQSLLLQCGSCADCVGFGT